MLKKIFFILSAIWNVFLCTACAPSFQLTSRSIIETPSFLGNYVIRENIDLKGKTVTLPDGCTLVFKGGSLRNGTLVGKNTRIKYKCHCFDAVEIRGTWLVPVINTSMFFSRDYNSLRNLVNLQNEKIHNDIIISRGDYHINSNTQRATIVLKSNVTLRMDGTLIMDPEMNQEFYNGYYAIYVYGAKNVAIKGSGTIYGDLGKSGIQSTYGHGISVFGSENVYISGITIKDVQGDGVDISLGNKDIFIKDITIDHYYRNGISIVDGDNIRVESVLVSNGGGVEPYAAIDVEPDEGNHISNVTIKNLRINNCGVGIAGYVPQNASVNNVSYERIRMSGVSICCMNSANFLNLTIKDVAVENCAKDVQVMRFIGNEHLTFSDVKIYASNNKAKFPFYLDSQNILFKNCLFVCPQLFSFHLANTRFENTKFSYDSFVWTATHLTNNNLSFDSCDFNGPLYIRPNNVSFRNCSFKSDDPSMPFLVCFEEPTSGTTVRGSSVVMENTIFWVSGSDSKQSAIRCMVKNSSIGKVRYKKR